MGLEPGLAESYPAKRSRSGAVWGKKNHSPSCAEKLWAVSMKKGKGTHKKEERGLREGEVRGAGVGAGEPAEQQQRERVRGRTQSLILALGLFMLCC